MANRAIRLTDLDLFGNDAAEDEDAESPAAYAVQRPELDYLASVSRKITKSRSRGVHDVPCILRSYPCHVSSGLCPYGTHRTKYVVSSSLQRTNQVVAILPFVVAARYDIQVGWGHGGWAMPLWLGGSPHVILRWMTWIE